MTFVYYYKFNLKFYTIIIQFKGPITNGLFGIGTLLQTKPMCFCNFYIDFSIAL